MNKIVFEIIAGLLWVFITKEINSPQSIELFLVISITLRIIWNIAIVIHGLGHYLVITAIDRQLSNLKISDVLEQRSSKTILKSLLPLQTIFIPGFNSPDSLWLAAGDNVPQSIRLKALGGIGLNLFVAAIALAIDPKIDLKDIAVISDYSWMLVIIQQAIIWANLAIAISSYSDVVAFFTGFAERFYCGNFGFICRRGEDEQAVLLPERMLNMYYQMGRETEIRGEQAGGGLVIAQDRQQQTVFVGKKVVNKKRDNLTNSLEAAFSKERKKRATQTNPFQNSVTGVWHYRFGTSGPPAVAETHWHEWSGDRQADIWQFAAGEWSCQSSNLNHRITHNGDFDSWQLYGQEVANKDLGMWLERVLHVSNYAQGDSPKIAGMMDFLITKGIWSAAVRLAYYLAIADSVEFVFAGQKPSRQAPDTSLPQEDLNRWVNYFEQIFLLYRRLLSAPNSPAFNQYLYRLEHDILQVINQDQYISQWTWQKRINFVRTAIQAFFYNDPYLAVKTFMAGAEGSFGLVVVSTLEPERLAISAQGQPISIGFNWQDAYMVYASEPAAVDAVLLNLPESYRLDLDQKGGEIALVSADEIEIYSFSKHRDLTPTELSQRWISMNDHPYLPHVKYPQNNAADPVQQDNQEIPAILEEIRAAWQNPNSINCQTADYLIELLGIKAAKLAQKRQKMVRAGLCELTKQLPTLDLLIVGVENSLWLGERFTQDLRTVLPWLNIKSISANEILQIIKYDFGSLQLGQDSIVLAVTQSGQTFPTVQAINAFDRLYRQGVIGELFIFTGELGSFLGTPVIKHKDAQNKDKRDYPSGMRRERHKIFVNGSGRRTAEAASITVAASQHTFTELLFHIAKQLRQIYPDSDPFGMTLTEESISVLEKMRDDFLELNAVQIMGVTATGQTISSATQQQLIKGGRQWAWHVMETPTAWAIHAFYVAITVGWAIPFGYTVPLAKTVWSLVTWIAQIPPDWFLLRLIDPLVAVLDIGIYVCGSWLWTLCLRYLQGRQLFARIGKRTLVIGDVPWVNKILGNYVSKLFSLSYGIASLEVHGANPENDLLHDYGHRVVRGTLLFLGVPDGRRSQRLKQQQNAVIMTGKQADGVRNIDVGPEVMAIGSNPAIADQGFQKAIVLESSDDCFYFDKDDHCFQDKSSESQRALIEELRESRFNAFERLLASYVFFWALAKKVASFPLLQYQHWKSQSRTKIMTTAAPVSGLGMGDLNSQPKTAKNAHKITKKIKFRSRKTSKK